MSVGKQYHEEDELLKSLPAKAGAADTFSLPGGYFESLPEIILRRARIEDMAPKDSDFPFSAPVGYFEELPSRVQAAIAAKGWKEQHPEDGFVVPEGYFEQLSDKLLQRISPETTEVREPAKVRRLNWISYAAAACITIAIGTGILLNQQSVVSVDDQLAAIPDQEIIQYLQDNTVPGDVSFIKEHIDDASGLHVQDALPEDEIEYYLNNTL